MTWVSQGILKTLTFPMNCIFFSYVIWVMSPARGAS